MRAVLLALFAAGHPNPVEEYRWHPTRRWRFDGAYPAYRLAYEVEGGSWVGGRHVSGSGFGKDCHKYNAAALMGWTVLRFSAEMVREGEMFETMHFALVNCRAFGRPAWTSAPSDPLVHSLARTELR